MQSIFEQFRQTLADPNARHAAIVHFPVVLAILGFLPLIALALTGFRSFNLKVVCLVWFLLASGAAYLAADAGEHAVDALHADQPPLSTHEHDAISAHEELGELGWVWPLIPAGLVLITFASRRVLAVLVGSAALLASLGVGGWAALTAHSGGRLVYVHGLGAAGRVPQAPTVDPAPAAPPPASELPSTPAPEERENPD